MSQFTNLPPLSHAPSHESWQKPGTKSILMRISLGAVFLIGALFFYKSAIMTDGIVNAALTTCTQGTFIYSGGYEVTLLMKMITFLGSTLFLILISSVVCIGLYLKKIPSLAIFFGLQMTIGASINHMIKYALSRPRPNSACLDPGIWTGSFPSGHTMMSTVFLGTLAFLLTRDSSDSLSRFFLMMAAIILGLLIGISRLYLGVHWFSDVIGGWLFGILWTIIGLNFLSYWENRFCARHP